MPQIDYAGFVAEAFEGYPSKFGDFREAPVQLALAALRLAQKRLSEEDFAGLERHRFREIAESAYHFENLQRRYEGAGQYDLLEAYAKPGEWGALLPTEKHMAIIDRFVATGQGRRSVRIWRHFISKIGSQFWFWVRERDAALVREIKGRATPLGSLPSEEYIASTGSSKATLLEAIRLAEPTFSHFGTKRDRDWLARQRKEVEAECREVVTGKPNPAPMTEDLFWQLLSSGGKSVDERLEMLPERIAAYGPKAIRTFGQMVADKTAAAYRTDLWALAYLLMGGASDDAFSGFRNWLLLQGRETYEGVLADPDNFDVASLEALPIADGLSSIVEQAYELRTGKVMPRLRQRKFEIGSIDEETFASILPKVAAATA
jgi:hypothetical protein